MQWYFFVKFVYFQCLERIHRLNTKFVQQWVVVFEELILFKHVDEITG